VTPTSAPVGNFVVTVGVYNEAGELIKQVQVGNAFSPVQVLTLSTEIINSLSQPLVINYGGPSSASWDGTGQDGNPVSNGQYYVKVDSADPTGNVTSVTQPVLVNRSLAQFTLNIYNESGEIVRHILAFTEDAGGGVAHSVSLSSDVFSPAGGSGPISVLADGKVVGTWDGSADNGTLVSSGTYFISVHELDGKGNESNITQAVVVLGSGSLPNSQVRAVPNVIQGSGGTVFQMVSPQPLSLRVTVYDLAGEKVAVREGSPGGGQVGWDTSGLASGLYLAVVECRTAGGQLARRQILRIAVLR
jgi:flagellar hook assembly protein FlgD